jgi:hypothetical protein
MDSFQWDKEFGSLLITDCTGMPLTLGHSGHLGILVTYKRERNTEVVNHVDLGSSVFLYKTGPVTSLASSYGV